MSKMTRLDTNIYQEADGALRVYTCVLDPLTGTSKKAPRRFRCVPASDWVPLDCTVMSPLLRNFGSTQSSIQERA